MYHRAIKKTGWTAADAQAAARAAPPPQVSLERMAEYQRQISAEVAEMKANIILLYLYVGFIGC